MLRRSLLGMAAFVAVAALPAVANAYSARVSADVNMRSGPGTYYDVVYVVPYGATVEVYDCSGWCHITYAGYDGYVAASYVYTGEYRPPAPRYQAPRYQAPRYEYRPPRYEAPRYRPRYNY